jgi:uncharacterized YigZ family protein
MRVLTKPHTFHMEEKKSRFTAVAVPVGAVDEAMTALSDIRVEEATHNCYAYRIGEQYRFFDDGEPSGTAGKPILAAIDRQGIDRCLVVVVRFFGGIKLGAGGLARAYGKCASECLRQADTAELKPRVRVSVRAPFDVIGDLYPVIHDQGADKQKETFGEKGICLDLELDECALSQFKDAVLDATRGRATLGIIDEKG